MLSVDIVFDQRHADLTQEEVQQRWIQFIQRGCFCAIFAGPPCESWTRSRIAGAVPGISGGDGGPRMLRTGSTLSKTQGTMTGGGGEHPTAFHDLGLSVHGGSAKNHAHRASIRTQWAR